ncbi:MAG: hypothetical protein QXV22_02785, partial [Thermoplasmataceae archaeon]
MLTDDTLREGLQTPGLALSIKERMDIARQLSATGIKRALVSYPPAHWSEIEVTKTIIGERLFEETFALGRTVKEDIDTIYDTGASISLHLPFKIDDLSSIQQSIKYASSKGRKVEVAIVNIAAYSPDQVAKLATTVDNAGADVIQLPDTTGSASPNHVKNVIETAKRIVNASIEVHCHNDSGASVINAITAFNAGADFIDCTAFGIGERNGISDLATIDSILTLSGHKTGIKKPELLKLYEKMADVIIKKLGPDFLFRNFPVYGKNASIHTAGTHAAFSDTFRGDEFSVNVYTGRSMIGKILSVNGISLPEEKLKELVAAIKDLSVNEGRSIRGSEIVQMA